MESENHQENNLNVCERCKINLVKTELMNVFQCPMCKIVIEKEQKKMRGKNPSHLFILTT